MGNTKRPVIGIVPLVDIGRESLWMLPGYMRGVELAGGVPVMLPLTGDAAEIGELGRICDGFLFSGGQDVSPDMYGEGPEGCGEICPERDRMESALLDLALREDRPVLGICRGIQFINAALGGKLYRDLPSEHPSTVCHRQAPPYDRPVHMVTVARDTPLWDILGRDTLPVNSCHHQAVRTLAPDLVPMAASEDGLVEALRLPTRKYVWAVQWHPEFCPEREESLRLFRSFTDACR